MRAFRESRVLRGFVLPLSLALWICSCTKWSDPKLPVEDVMSAPETPGRVRVTLFDGSRLELDAPRLLADTLQGLGKAASRDAPRHWVSIPLSDVRSVEVRKANTVGTVVLVGVSALVAAGIVAAIADAAEDDPPPAPPPPISCPLVYSWDGTAWRLDSGTFAGAFLAPLARTDVDNLVHLEPVDGWLRLRLANELSETDHVDALAVLAVDHPIGTSVAADATGRIHVVGAAVAPRSARDDRDRDALAALAAVDGWGWESSPTGRDTTEAGVLRDGVELVFDRPPGADRAVLLVDGQNTPWTSWLMQEFVAGHGRETDAWYAARNADPMGALALGAKLAAEAFLAVSVWDGNGWSVRGHVPEIGPELPKTTAVPLDLTGLEGPVLRVRLESAPMFWNLDRVVVDFAPGPAAEARWLTPATAEREGDGLSVADLLAAADGREVVLEKGEAVRLEFPAPPAPEGLARSYLLASTGWYRIHAPPSDADPDPDVRRVETEPGAVSRLSVARANLGLEELARRSEALAAGGR